MVSRTVRCCSVRVRGQVFQEDRPLRNDRLPITASVHREAVPCHCDPTHLSLRVFIAKQSHVTAILPTCHCEPVRVSCGRSEAVPCHCNPTHLSLRACPPLCHCEPVRVSCGRSEVVPCHCNPTHLSLRACPRILRTQRSSPMSLQSNPPVTASLSAYLADAAK